MRAYLRQRTWYSPGHGMGWSGSSSSGTTLTLQRLQISSPQSHSRRRFEELWHNIGKDGDLPPLKSSVSTEQSTILAKSLSCRTNLVQSSARYLGIGSGLHRPSGGAQCSRSQFPAALRQPACSLRLPPPRSPRLASLHQTSPGPRAQAEGASAVCKLSCVRL